jgi:hypothetical protein
MPGGAGVEDSDEVDWRPAADLKDRLFCQLRKTRGLPPHRAVVITALGIGQILAWGTSFYFPAVFAGPIVADTGWSLGIVVGGTSIEIGRAHV